MNRRADFAVRDRDGRYYAVDDRGDVVWVSSRGERACLDESAARAIVASYAESTRRRRRIEVVRVPGE